MSKPRFAIGQRVKTTCWHPLQWIAPDTLGTITAYQPDTHYPYTITTDDGRRARYPARELERAIGLARTHTWKR